MRASVLKRVEKLEQVVPQEEDAPLLATLYWSNGRVQNLYDNVQGYQNTLPAFASMMQSPENASKYNEPYLEAIDVTDAGKEETLFCVIWQMIEHRKNKTILE